MRKYIKRTIKIDRGIFFRSNSIFVIGDSEDEILVLNNFLSQNKKKLNKKKIQFLNYAEVFRYQNEPIKKPQNDAVKSSFEVLKKFFPNLSVGPDFERISEISRMLNQIKLLGFSKIFKNVVSLNEKVHNKSGFVAVHSSRDLERSTVFYYPVDSNDIKEMSETLNSIETKLKSMGDGDTDKINLKLSESDNTVISSLSFIETESHLSDSFINSLKDTIDTPTIISKGLDSLGRRRFGKLYFEYSDIDRNHKIWIPQYGQSEITLKPTEKSVYLFYALHAPKAILSRKFNEKNNVLSPIPFHLLLAKIYSKYYRLDDISAVNRFTDNFRDNDYKKTLFCLIKKNVVKCLIENGVWEERVQNSYYIKQRNPKKRDQIKHIDLSQDHIFIDPLFASKDDVLDNLT